MAENENLLEYHIADEVKQLFDFDNLESKSFKHSWNALWKKIIS